MTRTVGQRNLDAEKRAVEAGHRAFAEEGTGAILVKSDTYPGKRYRVTFTATRGGAVVFTCAPEGEAAYRNDHLTTTGNAGSVPCMHAAVAARRLEREKLIRFDGNEWVDAGRAPVLDRDPFDVMAGR